MYVDIAVQVGIGCIVQPVHFFALRQVTSWVETIVAVEMSRVYRRVLAVVIGYSAIGSQTLHFFPIAAV